MKRAIWVITFNVTPKFPSSHASYEVEMCSNVFENIAVYEVMKKYTAE